jgi:hypothetical protein
MIAWALVNWRLICQIIAGLTLAGCMWHIYHTYQVVDGLRAEIVVLNNELVAAKKILLMRGEIENEKIKIDVRTYQNISTIRVKKPVPHTVLVPAGRLR